MENLKRLTFFDSYNCIEAPTFFGKYIIHKKGDSWIVKGVGIKLNKKFTKLTEAVDFIKCDYINR